MLATTFNFYSVIKTMQKLVDYKNTYWCDGSDEYFCTCCDENENHNCDKDCVYEQTKNIVENLENISFKKVADALVVISRGLTYTSRNMSIWNESCAFCDGSEGKHSTDCPTFVISHALGIMTESDRHLVELALYTDEAEQRFLEAIELLKNVDAEKARLEAISKQEAAEAKRKEKLERTCRYCGRVLKSKQGRLQHEKESVSCSEQYYAQHPEALAAKLRREAEEAH